MSRNSEKAPVKNYFWYDVAAATSAIPAMLGFRPKRVYESDKAKQALKRGGALVIANHNSFWDPVYLLAGIWFRRQHFVCTKDLAEHNRFTRWAFRQFHCILIDRDNFSMNSLRAVSEVLKAGKVVSMFPEGHVNAENSQALAPFKSGMILLAQQGESPIVPVYIKKPKRFYNRLVINVGEPVDIRALYGERPTLAQIGEAAKLLQDKEEKLKTL
ncbi:MAG: 1-acyl-sn-glycerol-3-phosphate acyltransferase [Clostridia bacterium]|nr:1-acyl-sn-glycerol-3-phosphate acyltransferase [Clostridia bacterium]